MARGFIGKRRNLETLGLPYEATWDQVGERYCSLTAQYRDDPVELARIERAFRNIDNQRFFGPREVEETRHTEKLRQLEPKKGTGWGGRVIPEHYKEEDVRIADRVLTAAIRDMLKDDEVADIESLEVHCEPRSKFMQPGVRITIKWKPDMALTAPEPLMPIRDIFAAYNKRLPRHAQIDCTIGHDARPDATQIHSSSAEIFGGNQQLIDIFNVFGLAEKYPQGLKDYDEGMAQRGRVHA